MVGLIHTLPFYFIKEEIMMKKNFKSLDLTKLSSKKITVVSSEESLKDIEPFDWSK